MRDLLKKKRDEQKKMMWRLTPVHKKLQARFAFSIDNIKTN